MSKLQSRLRKLEAVMTDDRGLIPHSPRWLAYWTERIGRIFAGEEPSTPGCIPLDAFDAVLAAARAGDATCTTITR
jgi:hypothetical protein